MKRIYQDPDFLTILTLAVIFLGYIGWVAA